MIWGLFKKLMFFVILLVGLSWGIMTFSPKTFEENTVQRCITDNGIGLCAGKSLPKGYSIGLIGKMNQDIKSPIWNETGKLLSGGSSGNIVLKELPIEEGRVDIYGYTTKAISEGDRLTYKD